MNPLYALTLALIAILTSSVTADPNHHPTSYPSSIPGSLDCDVCYKSTTSDKCTICHCGCKKGEELNGNTKCESKVIFKSSCPSYATKYRKDYVGACTARPTPFPTRFPTSPSTHSASPTTANPTTSPSVRPTTAHPAASPTTANPTVSPSTSPTTANPTANPSVRPTTATPTANPSIRPTTAHPTANPTGSPTTSNPTVGPTASPATGSPTVNPSDSPTTANPTASPSASPITTNPTASPTTASPSATPSVKPTTTNPTVIPTSNPTVGPTASPTTGSPTANPSAGPTTASPSANPTPLITLAPTSKPTLKPTDAFTQCDCTAKCSLTLDPYLNNFNGVQTIESVDELWHNMYTYSGTSVQTLYHTVDGAAWVANVTAGSNEFNLDLCWNGNPPTPTDTNQRWWFPTTTVINGDETLVLDVSCVTKNRIMSPYNTRLDVYITKTDNNIPFPSDPRNNAFLEYEIQNGYNGICMPGSSVNVATGPVCTCS